jgi:hypothetical protein
MPGRSRAQTKLSAKWEELTAGDFKEAIVKAQGTCLLPFGILEKHGPHLPLGIDLLNARYVAEHAAQEEYAIISPSTLRGSFPKPSTSRAPSPIVPSCNCVCCRKSPTKWPGTVAKRS